MALSPGTVAPAFQTIDTQGRAVSLGDLAGKMVVLYFYPKDDTPGCTKEACGFRDHYGVYEQQNLVVLGVSRDDQAAHQAFTQKYNLPFPLLVDTDGALSKAYDVDGGGYSQRVTYVINPQGQIERVYTSVKTDTHATDILADLGLG